MGWLKCWIFIVAVSLISLNMAVSFAQEKTELKEQAMEKIQNQAAVEAADTLWLWGEVSAINAANKQITVKYLDYDTDNENEINITVDDKTTYEYVKALGEIKLQDTVSIDYILGPQDKYVAKNISVEKPDEAIILPTTGTLAEPEDKETLSSDSTANATEPVEN